MHDCFLGDEAKLRVMTRDFPEFDYGVLWVQVNGVVRGAALLFRQLESVSLRRATHLSDSALTSLAKSCGPHLKV